MIDVILALLWLAAALAVGAMAPSRNRSGGAWTLLALGISPLLAVLCLIAAGTKPLMQAPKPDPLAAMTRASSFHPEPVARVVRKGPLGFLIFLAVFVASSAAVVAYYECVAGPQPAQEQQPAAQVQQEEQHERGSLVLVPEPDPASQGILLDRAARAGAPLVPLN